VAEKRDETRELGITVDLSKLAVIPLATAKPTQKTLYHYTRRGGLLGIVRDKQVWASNARYLNDAQELSEGRQLLLKMLDGRGFPSNSPESRFREDFKSSLDVLQTTTDVFVFSLSERDDSLSQWRSYCRAGNGYAVGFDVEGLQAIAKSSWGYLSKCRYHTTEQEQLMQLVIDDALARLKEDLGKYSEEEHARRNAIVFGLASFLLAAPMVKNQAFEEEREWRLLLPHIDVWTSVCRFRDGGKLLVPYVELSSAKYTNIITHVRIGPTAHEYLESRAVSGLLTVSGYPDAEVKNSVVPFRDFS